MVDVNVKDVQLNKIKQMNTWTLVIIAVVGVVVVIGLLFIGFILKSLIYVAVGLVLVAVVAVVIVLVNRFTNKQK
jgi:undecaprenyl pyrophosphate phosphatase UppP